MAVQDNLTYGQRKNMQHNVREMKRYGEIFLESVETVRRTAPAILVGLEEEYAAISRIMMQIDERWSHYELHQEWPDNLRMPRASARKRIEEKKPDGSDGGTQGGQT